MIINEFSLNISLYRINILINILWLISWQSMSSNAVRHLERQRQGIAIGWLPMSSNAVRH